MSRNMNEETWPAATLTRTSRRRFSIYERAVLSALKPLRRGSLTLTLPDGREMSFGDGSNPRRAQSGLSASIRVVRADFFRRCFYYGDIGLAEAYMAGDWVTDDLAEVVSWFILNADLSGPQSSTQRTILNWLGWMNNAGHRLRRNSIGGSRQNIAAHYDLSNDFFALFLDKSMTYSSAIFDSTRGRDQSSQAMLEDAQSAKYQRLCSLLELKRGDRVLEIGGGWGAFSRYAATRYGCHVTTVTISEQQHAWAARRLQEESLEGRVDLRLLDYRKLTGQYDKIVSIEMLEAVGHDYFDTFFAKCNELLAPNGLLALQVITCPESRYDSVRKSVDFIQKHVFPGGLIPSTGALLESVHRVTNFTLRNLADFGDSYARTLEIWSENFEARLPSVHALHFDEIFIRKWRYYLMYCLAAFRMRHVSVVQMLLTRPNNHDLARSRP
jgi:cyclopropane-fatty-acyl-phospholipid synthase